MVGSMPDEAHLPTADDFGPEPDEMLRKRRLLYTVSTLVLSAVMALAVLDAFGVTQIYGVRSAEVSATGGGFRLEVQYGAVSRPALATPFEIRVTRRGGFDGPLTIGVDRHYLKLWDANGLFPAPSAETGDAEMIQWEFDPPGGDELVVTYDARIEPAAQTGRNGFVAILVDGEPVVSVDFETQVRP
jgi:hypothetical protein